MSKRDAWKTLSPDEQLRDLVRKNSQMANQMRHFTRLQGIRLESHLVAGVRTLVAVVDDPTASNDGAIYQIAP